MVIYVGIDTESLTFFVSLYDAALGGGGVEGAYLTYSPFRVFVFVYLLDSGVSYKTHRVTPEPISAISAPIVTPYLSLHNLYIGRSTPISINLSHLPPNTHPEGSAFLGTRNYCTAIVLDILSEVLTQTTRDAEIDRYLP